MVLESNIEWFCVSAVPRKVYTFLPDPQYVRDDMLFDEHDTLHTLHNWIPLSARACLSPFPHYPPSLPLTYLPAYLSRLPII